MAHVRGALFARLSGERRVAARLVAALPAYQVALWPDGWVLEADGTVRVCDTHAMAEARRWYALAGRNAARGGERVMALHGVFVPRVIVDLASRQFPTELAASVAVQLVAGEWVKQRRAQLLCAPERALRERTFAWQGSHHHPGTSPRQTAEVLQTLLEVCVKERMIPDADYRIQVRPGDGFGICTHRCMVAVGLDRYTCERIADVLRVGVLPWNRTVVRDGAGVPLIAICVGGL